MKAKRIAVLLLTGVLSLSLLAGCSQIDKDATLATMGDTEVSLGLVNFMCRYEQALSDDYIVPYIGEDAWHTDVYGNGTVMQEDLKSQILESVHEMYTLKEHADEYNVALTDAEKTTIEETAKAFMDANSKEAIAELGATQEIVEEMLTLYTIKDKMYDAIVAEVDVEISDEEANMRGYDIVTISAEGYYDESYQYVEYTDEEKEAAKEQAEAIAEAVADGEALSDAAEAEGLTVTERTYAAADTGLEEVLKTALDELEEGEDTGLVEGESSYYIAVLTAETDEEATNTNRETIIAERQDNHYTEVLTAWQEDDGWDYDEKLLEKINFVNLFTQVKETEAVDGTEGN